ncbi:hypothetical protein ABIE44_001421 [Marmoricola sp. OAE513]|uniref:hypothetical protein n=1 Tax=Marmoricola sp. OAE513 TaxID=2817894 RepID=UPI001AE22368
MFRDFSRAFAELFTARSSRWEISGLLLLLAMLPVSELVVTRMFSHLILSGPAQYREDPDRVVLHGSIFFVAYGLSRALHHLVRLNRVRVFRRGFDASGTQRTASKEAWSWAAAFELSTALVSLIQVAAFCTLFAFLDLGFGLANVLITAAVLWLVATIYHRQLTHQVSYLAEGSRPGSTTVGDRVGKRIRDAELGAVVASIAMACSLVVVLYRAVHGSVHGADAIVLFIGLRMMYSQVGNLSASAMRFARVKARLTAGRAGAAEPDPDDELSDAEDLADDDAGELEGPTTPRPAVPTAHRATLTKQMLLAGQDGDLAGVRRFADRLATNVVPMQSEHDAQLAAEAFALAAAGAGEGEAVRLMWWARPFPGTVGNWLSPLLVGRLTDRPVVFQPPGSETDERHLVGAGSILGSVQRSSVVVGTGALNADAALQTGARFVSVRGPLTAELLHRSGGPQVTRYGDPTVLASRVLPVERRRTNGRLAFVRHVSDLEVPVVLGGGIVEVSGKASRPGDIEDLVRSLARHDGVISSDSSVVALCHSYGIPCAPVAFGEDDLLGFVFADYGLGVGIGEVVPTPVPPDLRLTDWSPLLVTRTISADVLDGIEAALSAGVDELAAVRTP